VRVYCIHGLKVEERASCSICNSVFKAGDRALNLTHIAVAIECLRSTDPARLIRGIKVAPLTRRGCFPDEDICWSSPSQKQQERPTLLVQPSMERALLRFIPRLLIHGNAASRRTERQMCFFSGVWEAQGTHLSRDCLSDQSFIAFAFLYESNASLQKVRSAPGLDRLSLPGKSIISGPNDAACFIQSINRIIIVL
jgi:hypothetical protein